VNCFASNEVERRANRTLGVTLQVHDRAKCAMINITVKYLKTRFVSSSTVLVES
jgi:hypothetical protein